jgi:transcriptional regulator with XRE-family HTH domain
MTQIHPKIQEIIDRCAKHDIRQKELADEAGMKQPQLSYLWSGKRGKRPSSDMLDRLNSAIDRLIKAKNRNSKKNGGNDCTGRNHKAVA